MGKAWKISLKILGWVNIISGILMIIGGTIAGIIFLLIGLWLLWMSKRTKLKARKSEPIIQEGTPNLSDIYFSNSNLSIRESTSKQLLHKNIILSDNDTAEIIFTNMAGIDIHIYNLSHRTAEYIMEKYESMVRTADDILMIGYNGLDVSEQRWIIMLEDVRCKELDEYVSSNKKLYKQFKTNKQYIYFDDMPGVNFTPQGVDLELLFSYPSEKAESIRRRFRKFLYEKKISMQAIDVYIRLIGKYLVENEHYMNYYKEEIRELFKVGLIIPIEDSSIDVLLKYLKMQQLREIAKDLGIKITARKKSELISQLIALSNTGQLKEQASKIVSKSGVRAFHVSPPPSDLITVEELDWFIRYSQTLANVIFGTLNIAAWNTVNVIASRIEGSKMTIVNNHPCKYCKHLVGKSINASKIDLKQLPPFHIGCRCRIERF